MRAVRVLGGVRSVGASFRAVTVIVKLPKTVLLSLGLELLPLSVITTSNVAVPFALGFNV